MTHPSSAPHAPIVQIRDATIAHGDQLVLRHVDLTMRPCDFFYLTGRVGAGKTSLIAMLTGQIPLREGHALVCGFDMARIKKRQIPYLRRELGIVFQDFKLLTDRSVYQNLLFALRATGWKRQSLIQDRIQQVLDLVGLSLKSHAMPNQLSGGEQQRVAIARAILNSPKLILADEPTGNLDPLTSRGILSLLRELAHAGSAVLMATHNYPLIQRFPARTFHCENESLRELQTPHPPGALSGFDPIQQCHHD